MAPTHGPRTRGRTRDLVSLGRGRGTDFTLSPLSTRLLVIGRQVRGDCSIRKVICKVIEDGQTTWTTVLSGLPHPPPLGGEIPSRGYRRPQRTGDSRSIRVDLMGTVRDLLRPSRGSKNINFPENFSKLGSRHEIFLSRVRSFH